MLSFDEIIAEFMAAEKTAGGRIRWVLAPRTDTAKAQLLVVVPSQPLYSVKLHMTANVHRVPLKYGFTLSFSRFRVFALDVNPASSHVNFTTLGKSSVKCTHWQRWPNDIAEPDDRQETHQQWFREFCKRARIKFTGQYRGPPHLGDQQLRLL